MPPVRSTALPLTLAVVAATALAGVVFTAAPRDAPPITLAAGGNGATVPFTEHEAEAATTNGTRIGPDYTQGSLASEASGRQAITLSGQGKYVEFTLTKPANSIVLRYSVPDGSQGTVSVQVNGTKVRDLAVTSKYSWLTAPWIAGAKEHHFYDESRALLGRDAQAGDRVRVQLDAGNVGTATVDLADFEQVAGAASQPANSLSVINYGATPNDGGDDANAFANAINAAKSQGREVWVPPGTFDIGRGLAIDQVTIRGAGNWHSVLHSSNPFLNNGQVQGNIKLYDFAVMGEVTQRVDTSPDNAYHGPLGSGSVISGLWMQHLKCGIWTMNGSTSNAVIENNRFLDLAADGLNFNGNVTDSVVRNNFLRNTGDDSLAMWSLGADVRDSFTNNTIVQPNLANGIAIYGGTDISVRGNLIRDTNALGGGIAISNQAFVYDGRFSPLAGTTTVAQNTMVRTGAINPNWGHPMSAIRFDSYDFPITSPVTVTDNRFVDSPYSAIQFVSGGGTGKPITGVTVDGASVEGVGTVVLQVEAPGSGRFSNVTASRVGTRGFYNCVYPSNAGTFGITRGSGNSGWDSQWTDCGSWPPRNAGDTPPTTTTTTPPQSGNVARGKPVSSSSQVGGYPSSNATDGNADSYWESTNNAFPQTLTVDFGAATSVRRLVLKLPPATAWGARTQTITVSGSADGGGFTQLVGSTGYRFDPASGNQVTVPVTANQRYLRLTFTGNTGWPAGQLSEFEAYTS